MRRGHWAIENQSHWVRDVVLGEDASQGRCGVIPHMLALRNTALAVLRFANYRVYPDSHAGLQAAHMPTTLCVLYWIRRTVSTIDVADADCADFCLPWLLG